jgi:hypothetical protein
MGTEEPILLGLILHCGKDEKIFRHPTRQLTSSAKAKEVNRPPSAGAFLFYENILSSLTKMEVFYYAYF